MINYNYDAPRVKDDTLIERIWAYLKIAAVYLFCFILACIVIRQYAFIGQNIIIYALIICICASLANYALTPNDRKNTMQRLERNFIIYTGALFLGHILLTRLMGLNINQTGVSLGLSTGGVTQNAAAGWIQMMLQFFIIGTPISHVGYEVKSIFTYRDMTFGKKTLRQRMEELQKTRVE